jgi:hypothetical protein
MASSLSRRLLLPVAADLHRPGRLVHLPAAYRRPIPGLRADPAVGRCPLCRAVPGHLLLGIGPSAHHVGGRTATHRRNLQRAEWGVTPDPGKRSRPGVAASLAGQRAFHAGTAASDSRQRPRPAGAPRAVCLQGFRRAKLSNGSPAEYRPGVDHNQLGGQRP